MADKGLLPELEKQLKLLSERFGNLPHPVHAYIAGGMAVNYHTALRMSDDVDIEWSHKVAIPCDLKTFAAQDPEDPEDTVMVTMDAAFGAHIGSFHPDWKDDAPEILATDNLRVHMITPLDLVISKIGRFVERDREDIDGLAGAGLVRSQDVQKRGEETIAYYVGDASYIKYNLRDAVEIVRSHEDEPGP